MLNCIWNTQAANAVPIFLFSKPPAAGKMPQNKTDKNNRTSLCSNVWCPNCENLVPGLLQNREQSSSSDPSEQSWSPSQMYSWGTHSFSFLQSNSAHLQTRCVTTSAFVVNVVCRTIGAIAEVVDVVLGTTVINFVCGTALVVVWGNLTVGFETGTTCVTAKKVELQIKRLTSQLFVRSCIYTAL